MKEKWKDISLYKGSYKISNFGRVKSMDRFVTHWRGGNRLIKGKILKLKIDRYGYAVVNLL